MNTTIILFCAALLTAAVVTVLTAARRRETTGVLSRETRSFGKETKRALRGKAYERDATKSAKQGKELAIVGEKTVVPWVPPDKDSIDVSRRQFFNRATIALMGAGITGFGAASLSFLWKSSKGGFGSKINVGKLNDIVAGIRANQGFLYLPEARAWVTEYPQESLTEADAEYSGQGPVYEGMSSGIVALYQKCPHLGCRVPECKTSQWFECPCHGSQFNRVGEKKGGPAPRGMDRFGVSVNNDNVTIDTGTVFSGPAIGVNTTGQEAEGPNCVGGDSH